MIRKMVVHCKRDRHDVYIGRPSKWGNPFEMKSEQDRDSVIEKYKEYLDRKIQVGELDPTELKGKVLGCWCAPRPCHGDVLAEYANRETCFPCGREHDDIVNEMCPSCRIDAGLQ